MRAVGTARGRAGVVAAVLRTAVPGVLDPHELRSAGPQLPNAGILVVLLVFLAGCTQRPDWADDPAAATPDFWLDRPPAATATADDYDALWNAAEASLRRFGYAVDLRDYRGGRLTTEPRPSGQFFEPWRDDVRTAAARLESSLAGVRRTVRIELERRREGGYAMAPRVLVERETVGERRVTAADAYRATLGRGGQRRRSSVDPNPRLGWHPVGRDAALERALVRAVSRNVKPVATTDDTFSQH